MFARCPRSYGCGARGVVGWGITTLDDLVADLAWDIDRLSPRAAVAFYAAACGALRPRSGAWASPPADELLDAALDAARAYAATGVCGPAAADLLAAVEEETPDADDPTPSGLAYGCWTCADVALRTAVGAGARGGAGPGAPGAGYGVGYALDPVISAATQRLFGVAGLDNGPEDAAALDAVLAEPEVLAGVAVVRDAVDHLAAHPEPDPADLDTVAALLSGLAP